MNTRPDNLTDSEHLASLWTQVQPIVNTYLAAVVPEYHARQEVLQNTAIVLVRKFAEYDLDRPFAAWALGVARFEVLKYRSKLAAGHVIFSDVLLAAVEERLAEPTGREGATEEALEQCMGELTERSRVLLRLRYTSDLSTDQIAQQVGVKPSAVRVALHRVRKVLRGCIDTRMGASTNPGRPK